MRKLFNIFILSLLLNNILCAKEPILATLVNIVSNEKQEFKIGMYDFICSQYGIITLEELYNNAKDNSTCRKSIIKFYKKKPNLRYFANKNMNVFQWYSLRFIDDKCIVNIAGEKSLSEFLLDEGLAIKIPIQIHKEYDFYFYKAQLKAKANKKGLWKENISKECTSSIYKKR